MEFFGLDIGSYLIKAVQFAKKGEKYQLVAFGSAPSTTKGLITDSESELTTLAEAIKKLHQELKIKTKNVVSALPQDQVFTQIITTPKLSEEELISAIKWEAEQYVPFPLDEATLDHQIIGQVTENNQLKNEVLLVAAPNSLIDKINKVLKTAGLNLISLETEIFSISRSLVTSDSGVVMIVDLGAKATDVAVIENQQVVFTHSIPTAGEAITRAISVSLGLAPNQAEAYKRAYGVDPAKLEGKVTSAIDPVLEVIVKEIEKTFNFFQNKEKQITRIILTGGTANLPESAAFFAKKMNLEIEIGDPFTKIEDGLAVKIPKSDTSIYATAAGLAMKEF